MGLKSVGITFKSTLLDDVERDYLYFPHHSALRIAFEQVYNDEQSNLLWTILLDEMNLAHSERFRRDEVFYTSLVKYVFPTLCQSQNELTRLHIFQIKELLGATSLQSVVQNILVMHVSSIRLLGMFNEPKLCIFTLGNFAACVRYNPVRYMIEDANILQQSVFLSENIQAQGLSAIIKYVECGFRQGGYRYKLVSKLSNGSASAQFQCISHQDCGNCVLLKWKNAKDETSNNRVTNVQAFVKGLHSSVFNSRGHWSSVIADLYEPGLKLNALVQNLNKMHEKGVNAGVLPPFLPQEEVKKILRNCAGRSRNALIKHDIDACFKQNMLACSDLQDSSQHIVFLGYIENERMTMTVFFVKDTLRVLKLISKSNLKSRTGFSDATFKVVNAFSKPQVEQGKKPKRALAHFGIDVPYYNKESKDVVMRYVPIVFAYTNSESEEMYTHLFEFAICVFFITGIKIIKSPKSNEWVFNKLTITNRKWSDEEEARLRQLSETNSVHELDINIIIADHARAIKNANAKVFNANHMEDFVHLKRNLFESAKSKDPVKFAKINEALDTLIQMLRYSRTKDQFKMTLTILQNFLDHNEMKDVYDKFAGVYCNSDAVESESCWVYNSYGIKGTANSTSHTEQIHNTLNAATTKTVGDTPYKIFELLKNIADTCTVVTRQVIQLHDCHQSEVLFPNYMFDMAVKVCLNSNRQNTMRDRNASTIYVNNPSWVDTKTKRIERGHPLSQSIGICNRSIDDNRVKEFQDAIEGKITYKGKIYTSSSNTLDNLASLHEWNVFIDHVKHVGYGLVRVTCETSTLENIVCECEDFARTNCCACSLIVGIEKRLPKIIECKQMQTYTSSMSLHNVKIGKTVFVPFYADHVKYMYMKSIQRDRTKIIGSHYLDENRVMVVTNLYNKDGEIWCEAELKYEIMTLGEQEHLTSPGRKHFENWSLNDSRYRSIYDYMNLCEKFKIDRDDKIAENGNKSHDVELPDPPRKHEGKITKLIGMQAAFVTLDGSSDGYELTLGYLQMYTKQHKNEALLSNPSCSDSVGDDDDGDDEDYVPQKPKRTRCC